MIKRFGRMVCGLALSVGLVACGDDETAEGGVEPTLSSAVDVSLIECPSSTTYQTSGDVLPTGGLLSFRGHAVALGLGALLQPTTIQITEPASRYMLVDLRAGGFEHFQFLAPITVTISYARCSRANINRGPLSVWHVDPVTGELLENMGGFDNKLTRTITFTTDHFSGYAIAN